MSAQTLLIVGATGLIGHSLIPALQSDATFSHLQIFALVRTGSNKAEDLKSKGISIVEGSYEDAGLLSELATKYDIILDAADSSKPGITAALLDGLKAQPGKGVLVHLTGTGNFIDGAGTGVYNANGKFWDDASEADIARVNNKMANGVGDRLVLDAGKEGVQAFVLCAGGIFSDAPGYGSYGVFSRLFVNNAVRLGYVPYIGDGTAVMQLIHLDDAVAALKQVLSLAVDAFSTPHTGPPESRWFNAGGKAYEWKTIAEIYGKALGKEVKQVPLNQAGYAAGLIASNMLVRDSRLTQLGWRVAKTDLASSVDRLLNGATLPL